MLKRFNYKQFGKTGIKVYLSISLTSFTFLYLSVSKNYISKDNAFGYLESRGYNPNQYIQKYGENKINLALAYLLLFSTKPLRLILSCVLSGYIVNRKANPKKFSLSNIKIPSLKEFGLIGFSLYTLYWISTGVILYILIKNKYINPDLIIDKLSFNENLKEYYNRLNSKFGKDKRDLALAYLLNAFLEVFRLPSFIYFFRKFTKK